MVQVVTPPETIDVSIVIPMLNEQENVAALYREITDVMDGGNYSWEVIFVDDGSTDGTVPTLKQAVHGDPRVSIIQLARRFGQTAALGAGFQHAIGQYIVPLDADLQNDPRDIARLIAKLQESPGYDVVSGWRKDRQDRFFTRRLPSIIANWIIARLTWTRIHDFGCTLKVYRREALEDVQLYGEMHRFLPAICQWRGARVAELVVNHRPREFGTSKYGMRRTIKVMLDLMTVKFMGDYLSKPIYFFGKLGLMTLAVAFVTIGIALMQRMGWLGVGGEPIHLNRNVLVMLGMMLCIMSVFIIMMGLLSELLVRIYHESQNIRPYRIRHVRREHSNGTGGDGANRTRPPSRLVEIGDR
jgi:glycosyltransferase involved in cell wall biosynthesis